MTLGETTMCPGCATHDAAEWSQMGFEKDGREVKFHCLLHEKCPSGQDVWGIDESTITPLEEWAGEWLDSMMDGYPGYRSRMMSFVSVRRIKEAA